MKMNKKIESPLKDDTFRRLFIAQITSLVGTGLATVALALLAYDLAGGEAGKVLGTALAIKMIAYIGISPIAGVVAQRFDRKRLLIALDVSRAMIIGFMPFVDQVWQIYLLIFLLNACSGAFTPTYQATIPEVLPDDERYTRALSYSRLAYDLENLISPTLAAFALLWLSYDSLFVVNCVTFLISAALVFTCRLPVIPDAYLEGSFWQRTFSGSIRYLKTPRLRGLLSLSAALAFSGSMVIVNTVIYVREELGLGDQETAIALGAYGLGSMIIALGLPRLVDRWGERNFMLSGGALMVVGLFFAALSPALLPFLGVWLLLGAGSSLVQTPAGRLLKRSSNHENRPEIYAAQFALSHACWLLAYPLAGWTGTLLGLPTTFMLMAFLALGTTLLAVRLWPSEDPEVLEHTHEAMNHTHLHTHDEHHSHSHEGWEGPEPHRHPHRHEPRTHKHAFVIDAHHVAWPR